MTQWLPGLCVLLLGALPVAAASAQEQAVAEAQIVRMSELVADTLPLALMLDTVSNMDPAWPFQDTPDVVDAGQLACVRGEMGSDRLGALLVKRVRTYARANPGRLQDDMRLLEGPGARLFSRIIVAGMAPLSNGGIESPSPDEVIAATTPEEFSAMFQLFNDAQYGALRELLGFPAWMNMSQGEAAGRAMGATFMVPMLMDAFGTCGVPMSVLTGGKDAGGDRSNSKKKRGG